MRRRVIKPQNLEALIHAVRDVVFLHVGVGRVFVDPWEAKIMANLRAAYDSCAADRGDMTTDQLFKGGPP